MHYAIERGLARFWFENWHLEFSTGRPILAIGIDYHGGDTASIHLALLYVQVFICFPPTEGLMRIADYRLGIFNGWGWGFTAYSDDIHFHHGVDDGRSGHGFSIFTWPWRRWHHARHEYFGPPEQHSYIYTLKSGERQERTATIQVEEREWRWLWQSSPVRRIRRGIDIKFSDEVGERTGSWKGGCVGCGYTMKKGETALECLRRMERERIF